MRRLYYEIDLKHLKSIRDEIVPAIFTRHQFELIEKKAKGIRMTQTERNEFSRAISKKMRAINSMTEKYGNILPDRLKLSRKYLKELSRKFKGQILISGSFLYKETYNDIDVFVISKYDKEDYYLNKFHINYIPDNSLIFLSLSKLCVSNRTIHPQKITEKVDIDTFISLYQELFNDMDKKHPGIKYTLRNYLLQSAYLRKASIPDTQELDNAINTITRLKNPKEIIKKIFVETIVMMNSKETVKAMDSMIKSYEGVMKEYKQHRKYYLDLIEPFREVIKIES